MAANFRMKNTNKTNDSIAVRIGDNGDFYSVADDVISVSYANQVRPSMDDIIAKVKKSLGFERVLEKCPACGQWGAVMCACPHCGHPIDPKQ